MCRSQTKVPLDAALCTCPQAEARGLLVVWAILPAAIWKELWTFSRCPPDWQPDRRRISRHRP
jgi:hypothetical protein